MDKCKQPLEGQQRRNPLSMKIFKTLIVAFLLLYSCSQNSAKKKPESKSDYSNVDYSKASNIIKNPEKLTGDEKAIFYHPFFLKLTSEEARDLDPFITKDEFEKLGIKTDQRDRFVAAYSFYKIYYLGHKVSCEQWESFKDLAPQFKN